MEKKEQEGKNTSSMKLFELGGRHFLSLLCVSSFDMAAFISERG